MIHRGVVGLVPATENLPSGTAVKPGDIIQTLAGKTVEVINTDAEGRFVREAETDEIGAVCIEGPNVFKGYWRMPEKTWGPT